MLETIFGILIPIVITIVCNTITVWKLIVYQRDNILYTPSVRFSEVPHQVSTERSLQVPDLVQNGYTPKDVLMVPGAGSNDHDHDHDQLFDEEPPENSENPMDDIYSPNITFISTTPRRSTGASARRIVKTSDLKLIRTILILTTVFVLMNLPSYLCRLFFSVLGSRSAWQPWLWLVSYLLYYCHHSVLFYFYIFNSEQMRKELRPAAIKLLECYCLKTVPEFGHEDLNENL